MLCTLFNSDSNTTLTTGIDLVRPTGVEHQLEPEKPFLKSALISLNLVGRVGACGWGRGLFPADIK